MARCAKNQATVSQKKKKKKRIEEMRKGLEPSMLYSIAEHRYWLARARARARARAINKLINIAGSYN